MTLAKEIRWHPVPSDRRAWGSVARSLEMPGNLRGGIAPAACGGRSEVIVSVPVGTTKTLSKGLRLRLLRVLPVKQAERTAKDG